LSPFEARAIAANGVHGRWLAVPAFTLHRWNMLLPPIRPLFAERLPPKS
jgi:hypothetical protein